MSLITDTSTSALPSTVPAPVMPASYPRRPDGTVDWRKLVRSEHLYVKGEAKEKVAKLLNKPVTEVSHLTPEETAKVPDEYLVIRKAGILELARLRGFLYKVPTVQFAQRDYVIVRTEVHWAPFEDIPAMVTGGVGEACPENTTELGSRYLAATAENRAFSRNVRDLLEIDIVSSEELGKDGIEPELRASRTTEDSGPSLQVGTPQFSLKKTADECSFNFTQVKTGAALRWKEDTVTLEKDPAFRRRIENDPAPWNDWADVPPRDCLTLINLMRTTKATRDANQKQKGEEAAKAAAQPTTVQSVPGPGATSTSAVTSPVESESKSSRKRKPTSAAVTPNPEGAAA